MMNDPMRAIDELFIGAGLLMKAEVAEVRPSPEYTAAFDMLEPHAEHAVFEGDYPLVIPITTAADLIADNYERRES